MQRWQTWMSNHVLTFIFTFANTASYTPRERKFRGVYRNHSICPSVQPSVCADSCLTHNYFLVWHWLTIFGTWVYHHETGLGLRVRCVGYIHDPDTTLNFDVKVKFPGFLTCFCIQPKTFFYFTLSYHIWHMGLSPWEDVSSTFMILIRRWPLTDLKVKFIGFMTWLCVQASAFCPLT